MRRPAAPRSRSSPNPSAFDHFDAAKRADPSLSDHLMVHKPWIDQVTFTVPGECGTYRRVPEVIDCWFDSGCMPFAQWGYPHPRAARRSSAAFPADFICEAIDQTRGWFYSLLMISTLLFGDRPYAASLRTHPAARRLQDFVDALSNWYVRRSRDRFWASSAGGASPDKLAAFATLYEVLVDLSRVLAPFVPFLADALHQNLVRGRSTQAAPSVHLTSFPAPSETRRNDLLRAEMQLVRDVVTLGQRVRASEKLKVRQPLGEAIVVVGKDEDRVILDRHRAMIEDELNVEMVSFAPSPEKYVEFQLLPNFRALGPKLGKDVPACKAALAKADGGALQRELNEKGRIEVVLPDRTVVLEGSEIEIRLSAKPGFAAASDRGSVVVLDTTITDALRQKGLARELVSKIQAVRKELDLAFEARIRVRYAAEGALAAAIDAHRDYIAGEVLASELAPGEVTEPREIEVEGQTFRFSVTT
jgi:isoleucyl-tRNA synthetase